MSEVVIFLIISPEEYWHIVYTSVEWINLCRYYLRKSPPVLFSFVICVRGF